MQKQLARYNPQVRGRNNGEKAHRNANHQPIKPVAAEHAGRHPGAKPGISPDGQNGLPLAVPGGTSAEPVK